jgi:hypothetical protein
MAKDRTSMSQRSFASAEYAMKKKRTRREKFLGEMERIVPGVRLIAVIEPLYPTSGRVGRQPIGASRMLRMYCLQQWYGLADEALEDALYDSQALRGFVGVDLSRGPRKRPRTCRTEAFSSTPGLLRTPFASGTRQTARRRSLIIDSLA